MTRTVNSYMTKNLTVVDWRDPLKEAYELMLESGVRHLPVGDDEGNIVGVISDRDFMRALQVQQPDFASGHPPKAEFDPASLVRDYMSWPVVAVDANTKVSKAARTMIEKKISCLLVTREQEVVGIVTTEDLLRILIDRTESMAEKVKSDVEVWAAETPVGQIVHNLANAGI